jgi:hypothetical protein
VIRQRLASVVVAMALTGTAFAVGASPVTATACSPSSHGNWCNGTSPQLTGCAATGIRAPGVPVSYIYSGSTQVGYVELRFSTACRTTWARVFYLTGFGSTSWIGAGIVRSDGTSYDYGVDDTCTMGQYGDTFCRDNVGPGVGVYGYQVYDGGYTSYAMGFVCGTDSSCAGLGTKYNHTGSY